MSRTGSSGSDSGISIFLSSKVMLPPLLAGKISVSCLLKLIGRQGADFKENRAFIGLEITVPGLDSRRPDLDKDSEMHCLWADSTWLVDFELTL